MKHLRSLLIFFLISTTVFGYDGIDQWRGPERNGHYPENNLLKIWPEGGPELLWKFEGVGDGYSSATTTTSGITYVSGKKDSIEYLTAIDGNGKLLWQLPYGLSCRQSFPDTRGTPTIEGDRIYVISCRGQVVCVDAVKQKIVWKVDALSEFAGEYARWEIAESPLIVDDKVIYTPGGMKTTMVALDKTNGKTIWQTESLHDSTAYVSPIAIERGNKKILINITRKYLIGIDAKNGKILWKVKYSAIDTPTAHPESPYINCISPVYHEGRLFITSGYDHTSVMFELSADGGDILMIWKQPVLDTHHGGVVLYDGYIYGSNWINNSKGNWICLDWQTGEIMYEKEWETKGSIIAADDMLYLYEERKGNVALVKPDPDNFNPVSTFQNKDGTGPHWAHPSIKDGILYLRHGKVVSAYKIGE